MWKAHNENNNNHKSTHLKGTYTLKEYTGWNDKIIALEKTWCHTRLMETGFLFLLLTIYYLASCVQIPRAIRAFYYIWEWHNVQPCSLPIQVMTTGPLPAPSKCKSGRFNVPRVMKTKFPATVMVFGVVSSEGHNLPPHIFEVGWKAISKVYLDVLKNATIPWWDQVAGGWPCVWQQDSAPAHKSKETQAWLQKECYEFVPFSQWLHSSPNWTH